MSAPATPGGGGIPCPFQVAAIIMLIVLPAVSVVSQIVHFVHWVVSR